MKLYGTLATIAQPESFDRIEVEADSYEEGREALLAQVPDGWRLISTRVDRG